MKKIIMFLCLCTTLFGYEYDRVTEEIVVEKLGMSYSEVAERARQIEYDRKWKLIELKVGQYVWYGVFIKKK